MSFCRNCGNLIRKNYYLCSQCFQNFILEKISHIKPSNIENGYCDDTFPNFMYERMPKLLRKDIEETLGCVKFEFWTATVLMSLRILETQLKDHIYSDLGISKDLQNIGKCIKIFQNHNYSTEFISLLKELKDLRNDAMHGEKRFGSSEAINILKKVLVIIAWIYNIQ